MDSTQLDINKVSPEDFQKEIGILQERETHLKATILQLEQERKQYLSERKRDKRELNQRRNSENKLKQQLAVTSEKCKQVEQQLAQKIKITTQKNTTRKLFSYLVSLFSLLATAIIGFAINVLTTSHFNSLGISLLILGILIHGTADFMTVLLGRDS